MPSIQPQSYGANAFINSLRIPVRMNTDSGMKLNTDSDFT